MAKIRSRIFKTEVDLPAGVRHEEVGWILCNSADDVCYSPERLTHDELLFCLEHEDRSTGLAKLKREARKRGIKLERT